jgi:hypothetical protein
MRTCGPGGGDVVVTVARLVIRVALIGRRLAQTPEGGRPEGKGAVPF